MRGMEEVVIGSNRKRRQESLQVCQRRCAGPDFWGQGPRRDLAMRSLQNRQEICGRMEGNLERTLGGYARW
eukprot:9545943-Heterocapsa_arctica.AAC.1